MTPILEKTPLIAAVKGILTFRFLSDGEILDLLSIADVLEYEEGEPIVEEGDISYHFFGILDGTVSVNVLHEDKQVYVCSLGAGDVFGEAGIFMNVKRTASILAQDKTLVLRIHRAELASFLKRHAEAGNKLLLVVIFGLLRKLRQANQELAYERKSDLAQDDVDAMVAS
ncbi:MAG: cyclic nucleotide-binding domain-containing protein, partial [Spirochaetaceae bacterium]|nr:cyclic nucleotide-binding domain-containing protein [Spirochaetaceae bacterium]